MKLAGKLHIVPSEIERILIKLYIVNTHTHTKCRVHNDTVMYRLFLIGHLEW